MASKKLIRISDDGMVHLCVSPVRWSMVLPNAIKRKLLDGAKNVAQVRSQITIAAKLRWMPPVEIVDEIWMCGKGTIHGRATPIKVGNSTHMGVQLPAQTAVHGNNEELRRILVHEFAHCFYFAEQGVSALESGQKAVISAVEDIYDNEEADRARLPKLSDWFDDADVVNFAYWNDPSLASVDRNIEELRGLNIVSPNLNFPKTDITLLKELVDHIHKLRTSDSGCTGNNAGPI